MSSERKITRREILITMLTGTTAFGLAIFVKNQSINTINAAEITNTFVPTDTPTPFAPETATSTSIVEATKSATPEPLPTQNPYDFKEIYLDENEELTFSLDTELLKTSGKVKLVYYIDPQPTPTGTPSLKPTPTVDILGDAFAPGKKTGLLEIENYKNIILYLHSGYKGKKLEAEDFRHFIEGGDYFATNSDYQIASNMNYLEGKTMTLEINNQNKSFEIYAVTQIPHSLIPQYDKSTKDQLDIIANLNPDFEYFKNNPQGILISFCGWGRENYKQNDLYSYSRYVIGLRPLN